jgi:hypothetical protein
VGVLEVDVSVEAEEQELILGPHVIDSVGGPVVYIITKWGAYRRLSPVVVEVVDDVEEAKVAEGSILRRDGAGAAPVAEPHG